MKSKKLLAVLTAVFMIVSLAPLGAAAAYADGQYEGSCTARVSLGGINADFKVPFGKTLEIGWQFINDGAGNPRGWQMLVNGIPAKTGDNIDGISVSSLPGMAAVCTTSKPACVSFSPTQEQCEAVEVVVLDASGTGLTRADCEFNISFVDVLTKETVGTGSFYTTIKYGPYEFNASSDRAISGYVTKNLTGYRVWKGEEGAPDMQKRTVYMGENGVTPQDVTVYVEVNHEAISDRHTQPVKFVCGDTTILETSAVLKSNWLGWGSSSCDIELNMENALSQLAAKGYVPAEADAKYSVMCNNHSHDPAATEIQVKLDPNHVHSYEDAVTAPTCTEKGFTTHTCFCGDSYTDTYTDALGHLLEKAEDNGDGTHSGACSRCADKVTADHEYGSGITAPTCTEKGFTTHTCSVCGDSYTDTYTDALGHLLEKAEDNGDGTHSGACSRCADEVTADHEYDSEITAPTCTENGFTTHTCPVCGDSYTDTYTDAPGHSFGAWTDAGDGRNHVHSCLNADCTVTETEAHKWDAGKITKEPTKTTTGEKAYTCTVCGAVRVEEIPVSTAAPKTGDGSGLAFWAAMLGISGTALFIAVSKKRKDFE